MSNWVWMGGESLAVICQMSRANDELVWRFCNHNFKSTFKVSTKMDKEGCGIIEGDREEKQKADARKLTKGK